MELIEHFKKVGGPASFGGVTPFTTNQLTTMHATYDVTAVARAHDLPSLETFSQDVDLWHNNAHMAIGMAVHNNLMNARTNVRLREFWQLHYFINDRFEEQLVNFEPGGQVATIVAQLETNAAAPTISSPPSPPVAGGSSGPAATTHHRARRRPSLAAPAIFSWSAGHT